MRAACQSPDSLHLLASGTFLRASLCSRLLQNPPLTNHRRFTATPPLEDPVALAWAVRRAVVEVLTRTLNSRSGIIAYTGPEELTSRVRVVVAADGSATLSFPGGVEAAIVAGGEAEVVVEQKEEVERARDEGWAQMRIAEDVLFDVVRRVVQLTGRRIPDPVVSKIATVGDIRRFSVLASGGSGGSGGE